VVGGLLDVDLGYWFLVGWVFGGIGCLVGLGFDWVFVVGGF